MRFLLIDDHPLVRSSLKQLLVQSFSSCTVEEAGDASSAMPRLNQGSWDLILLDIDLPDRSGVDLIRDIHALNPKSPVLVLSGGNEFELGQRVIRAGASGFVPKASSQDEILGAIRRTLSGKKSISPDLAAKLAEGALKHDNRAPHELLSEREFEVLRLFGQGCTTSSIADRMKLSVKTISTYRTRILEKLGLKTTGDLVRYAVSNKLV
jgi:two-component system, NarL family, invasion response regulator UvrY